MRHFWVFVWHHKFPDWLTLACFMTKWPANVIFFAMLILPSLTGATGYTFSSTWASPRPINQPGRLWFFQSQCCNFYLLYIKRWYCMRCSKAIVHIVRDSSSPCFSFSVCAPCTATILQKFSYFLLWRIFLPKFKPPLLWFIHFFF